MLMKSVGEKLRRERIQRGIDLDTLAGMTRINARYLEAIENGNPGNLPGGFFYRSFVRQYATALNLDMDEIEADLERAKEAEEPVLTAALNDTKFPVKQPDKIVQEGNRRASPAMLWAYVVLLAAVVVGSSLVYGWWRRMETASASQSEDRPAPAQSAGAVQPDRSVQPAAEPPEAARSGPVGIPVSAAPATAAASPSQQPLSPDDRVVLNLSAREDTWVSVTADGKTVFVGILTPNETKTLGSKEFLRIRTGNAGGLGVVWNGKDIGSIGPSGQVRTVVLTPDNYRISVPKPPAEAGEQDSTGTL